MGENHHLTQERLTFIDFGLFLEMQVNILPAEPLWMNENNPKDHKCKCISEKKENINKNMHM